MVTGFDPLSRPAALDAGRSSAVDPAADSSSSASYDWFAPDELNSAQALDPAANDGSAAGPDIIAARVLAHLGS